MNRREWLHAVSLFLVLLLAPAGAQAQPRDARSAYPEDGTTADREYRDGEADAADGLTGEEGQQSSRYRGPGTIRYAMHPARNDATSVAGDTTRTHIVKKGDTLWDLAHAFLGDPFTWPRIWKRNPQVANPHLIYPGNVLSISDFLGATSSSGSRKPRSFEEATAGFLEDSPAAAAVREQNDAEAPEERTSLESLLRDKLITSQFLRTVPFLWTEKDPRGKIYPGDARIDADAEIELFHQFDEVPVSVFGTTAYAVGDTLDVFSSERMVRYKDRKANLVRCVGRGVVASARENSLRVKLVALWGVVRPGDRLARARDFRRYEVNDVVDPSSALSARVFQRVEQTESPHLFQSLIIDRGSAEGIRLGDVFLVRNQQEQAGHVKPAQVACVSYVGEDFSTLTIVRILSTSLQTGDRAEMVKRIQFN
jgi:LysM repeat protein